MTYEQALNGIASSYLQLDEIDPRVVVQHDGIHLAYENSIWTVRTQEHGVVLNKKSFDDTKISIDECLKGIDDFLFEQSGKRIDKEILKNVVLNKPENYTFNWN